MSFPISFATSHLSTRPMNTSKHFCDDDYPIIGWKRQFRSAKFSAKSSAPDLGMSCRSDLSASFPCVLAPKSHPPHNISDIQNDGSLLNTIFENSFNCAS